MQSKQMHEARFWIRHPGHGTYDPLEVEQVLRQYVPTKDYGRIARQLAFHVMLKHLQPQADHDPEQWGEQELLVELEERTALYVFTVVPKLVIVP